MALCFHVRHRLERRQEREDKQHDERTRCAFELYARFVLETGRAPRRHRRRRLNGKPPGMGPPRGTAGGALNMERIASFDAGGGAG